MVLRNRLVSLTLAALAVPAAAFGLAACDDDDGGSEEDRAAIQASIDAINQATLDADADTFLQYVTDKGVQEIFFATPEQVRESPEQTIAIESESEFFTADEIEVDGDTAEVVGSFPGDDQMALYAPMIIHFIKDGDVWKADGLSAGDADEPENAQTIGLSLIDFSFEFDESELESGRPILFEVENDGEQPHHIVMVRLEEGVVLEEAIMSEDTPEGVEELGFAGPWRPGDGSDVAFNQNLEPGRYGLICFLPDTSQSDPEEQVPHAFLGMIKEFSVQ